MKHLPIIERAVQHADRIAIHCASGVTTYRELVTASEAIAAALLTGKTDLNEARIAFLAPPGKQYIATQWGIWRAGGIAVPLSLSATEHELDYTLNDSQASGVIAVGTLADRVRSLCGSRGIRLHLAEDIPSVNGSVLPEVAADRRAMILYTSGTTSTPKGVVTSHRCIQAQISSLVEAWRWESDDRIPLFLPLHHIHGIINVMSCALWSGAEIEAFPGFQIREVLQRVAAGAYSVFMAVPTIYVRLIEALEATAPEDREPALRGFASMRLMVSGSAALPASVHQKWTELTGQKLLERYGMTEIGMALSNPYEGERRPGAVGLPLPGVDVCLTCEDGTPAADEGVPGEIHIRGACVFAEYWQRSEATRESFVDGWFRTGDIAVREDGYYRIMGRSSVDIIKSGGYKLSALEIEACLLDHPSIVQCAVVGVPDETWGELVAAAVVLQGDSTLDLETLQTWCKERLSHYKMPRLMRAVSELPRNAMGKVVKPSVSSCFTKDDDGELP